MNKRKTIVVLIVLIILFLIIKGMLIFENLEKFEIEEDFIEDVTNSDVAENDEKNDNIITSERNAYFF